MSSYLSASWIYPVSSPALEQGVLAISDTGTIEAIYTAEEAARLNITAIRFYEGALVPGLINTHCHLELSHLWNKIPRHTGLPGFVQQVMQQRQASDAEIEEAMLEADAAMQANGIVAVGDISNQLRSRAVKLQSKLYYHTFVEAMGFNPERATEIINNAATLQLAFAPLRATIVPHAPYSVSEPLFAAIQAASGKPEESISIHNQETAEENSFFEKKTGHFLKLYEFLGLDISFFEARGKSSLQSYLPLMATGTKTLLVHNTFTSRADLEFAAGMHENLFWCLCPKANLYIENRLPDIDLLREAGVKITLGTDSLASNDQLNILAEMKTLQDEADVPFDLLLRWATLNGAAFLGITERFGSFEPGKQPGVNWIAHLDGDRLTAASSIARLF
jgi:cytosine/adenosine deaminase-related metal-dependent hydrolase